MKKIPRFCSVAASVLGALVVMSVARSGAAPIIAVGPNVQVSNDGDAAHVEIMAAANPKDRNNLLGTSITFLRPGTSVMTKTYSSFDSGYTWKDAVMPEVLSGGSADPQVAFGPDGAAYYTALVFMTIKNIGHDEMLLYRSADGGRNWSPPFNFGYSRKLGSFDHEQLAVDQGSPRFRGRVYIGVLYGPYPEYDVGIVRSSDRGRTFTGPILAASGHKIIGINDANLIIMSDGTLVVPYEDFPYETKKAKKTTYETIWTVESDDGGMTFSKPRQAERQVTGSYADMMARNRQGRFDDQTFADFAVDSSNGRFRDRIYMVWSDRRTGTTKVLVAHSDDRGKTWSRTKPLNASAPAWCSQFQPEAVVNQSGVVGVAWLDTRDSLRQDRFRQYFSASLDGGETFLDAVPVSSEPSFPQGAGNARLVPFDNDRSTPLLGLRFMSAFTRYPGGGDYMGLTADQEGAFHPFWADSRSGTFQIYTAKVQVLPETPASSARTPADITKKVALTFGTITFDPVAQVYSLPIQLQNISHDPLYGPMTLTVEKTIDPWDIKYDRVDPHNTFSILNASNHKSGVGANFDYSHALGTLGVLEPGSRSESVVWRVRMRVTTQPYFGVRVKGFVAK